MSRLIRPLSALLIPLFVNSVDSKRQGTDEAQVRALVLQVRAAADRADWQALSQYFPAQSHWAESVRSVVESADKRNLSFWTRDAKLVRGGLRTQVLRSGVVAVATPFSINGRRGVWGAVFVKDGTAWGLSCARESMGSNVPIVAGCAGPDPNRPPPE
jgi:hypothetical protein